MQNAEEENCEKVTSDDVFKKIGEFGWWKILRIMYSCEVPNYIFNFKSSKLF